MVRRRSVRTRRERPRSAPAAAAIGVRSRPSSARRCWSRSASSTRARLIRNPVIFIVEVGSVLTTLLFLRDLGDDTSADRVQRVDRRVPVVHRAVRQLRRGDGGGSRQGAGGDTSPGPDRDGRPASPQPTARSRRSRRPTLHVGDLCVVTAGEIIPGDGDIVEGIATIDESAITGESAPVVRESGGDRSAVTGRYPGAVRRDRREDHRRAGRDVHRSDDRARRGGRASAHPERAGAVDPARRADHRVPRRGHHAAAAGDLLGRRTAGRRAGGAARGVDPDDDRRIAVGDRHRRHGSAGAAQRAGDERPGRRSCRRRDDAAARQDRHDHLRQPARRRVGPGARRDATTSSPMRRSWRAPPTRRPRVVRSSNSATARARPAPKPSARTTPSWSSSPRRPGCRASTSPMAASCAREPPTRCGATSKDSEARFHPELVAVVDEISRSGGTPLVVADRERVLGVVHLKDVIKEGLVERFARTPSDGDPHRDDHR